MQQLSVNDSVDEELNKLKEEIAKIIDDEKPGYGRIRLMMILNETIIKLKETLK